MDTATRFSMFGFGAFGGVLPTLANLGTTFVTVPETPVPAIGMLYGIVLFAIVGGGIALTNATTEVRQAIFAGIAAPAIMMSIVAGVTENSARRRSASFISSAYAQEPSSLQNASGNTLYVSPTVVGGSNVSDDIPITAKVRSDGKEETVKIGVIKHLDGPTAFSVPPGIDQVFVMGSPVSITGAVTKTNVNIWTKPTVYGDFLWALGAPRRFKVEDLKVTPK